MTSGHFTEYISYNWIWPTIDVTLNISLERFWREKNKFTSYRLFCNVKLICPHILLFVTLVAIVSSIYTVIQMFFRFIVLGGVNVHVVTFRKGIPSVYFVFNDIEQIVIFSRIAVIVCWRLIGVGRCIRCYDLQCFLPLRLDDFMQTISYITSW